MTTRIAIIGDIHGHWDADDAPRIDALGYDLVVAVGDLAGLRFAGALAVARGLAALRTPAVWVPGNHDAAHPIQLLAEVVGQPALGDPLAGVQQRRAAALGDAVGPVAVGAYSLHAAGDLTVIAGRPFAMGGPTLSFPGALRAGYGVDDLAASAERLRALVDAAPTRDLVFVAHNGPAGLGGRRDDPWGVDFRAGGGDWGDPDLADAIAYARGRGRRVRAVAAGHMHRALRGGGERRSTATVDGVLFVNAAVVPRHRADGARHHVALTIRDDEVSAVDTWI